MLGDRIRVSRIRAEQDRALSRYVRYEVYPYSAFFRSRLDAAGLGRMGIRRQEDLASLPPVYLDELDPSHAVLRPDPEAIMEYAPLRVALTMRAARATGNEVRFGRAALDPEYKPVRWTLAAGVPVGYTAGDLDRLGELGRRMLELAGLRPADVLVTVNEAQDGLPFWQLALGARAGGIPSMSVPSSADPDLVADLHPTVIAGPLGPVTELLEGMAIARSEIPKLQTILIVGSPISDDDRATLRALAAEIAYVLPPPSPSSGVSGADDDEAGVPRVVAAYAPPGVRAMWSECRGGRAFHTWPDAEVVESVGGRLVWTGVDWRGTAMLRLATDVAGTVDDSLCPVCGRTTLRVHLDGVGRD